MVSKLYSTGVFKKIFYNKYIIFKFVFLWSASKTQWLIAWMLFQWTSKVCSWASFIRSLEKERKTLPTLSVFTWGLPTTRCYNLYEVLSTTIQRDPLSCLTQSYTSVSPLFHRLVTLSLLQSLGGNLLILINDLRLVYEHVQSISLGVLTCGSTMWNPITGLEEFWQRLNPGW